MMLELARTRNTNPVQTLIHEISVHGWTVTKVSYDKAKDGFVAKAKNSHGEEVEKQGHDENTAIAALLQHIIRKEKIRRPKSSAWQTSWVDKLHEVAQAYAKAPVFDPKAASVWKALADDSLARATVLQQQLHVEFTNNPHPYKNIKELVEDVFDKKHVEISRANTEHPVWTAEQVLAFRLCHEVLGHAAQGADFSWSGENRAFGAHAEWLTAEMQKALFTETVGTSAYSTAYHYGGPQKICLLNDVFKPVADKENPDGHSGIHPEKTHAPTKIPKVAALSQDPNYGYSSGEAQLPNAAYLWQDDPLDMMTQQNVSRQLESKWWDHQTPEGEQDFERMKQAVMNAFRATLLSPKKNLRSNAIHYQDLQSVPYHVTDPNVYYNALEGNRVAWNVSKGYHPDSHKPHFKEAQEYIRYVQAMNPQMPPQQAVQEANWDLLNMQREEEERLLNKNPDLRAEVLEPKVFQAMKQRLSLLVRNKSQGLDVPTQAVTSASRPRRALLAVDVQPDFIDGSLGGQTPEAQAERRGVIEPLLRHAQNADLVVASRDWHPPNHMSFSDQPEFRDGSWPSHAVQNTPGAEIVPPIRNISHAIVSKGQDPNREAYSAFDGTVDEHGGGLADYLRSHGIQDVDVGGLATDYCVRATALDAAKHGFNTTLKLDASAGVDPQTSQAAIDEMRQAGVGIDSGENTVTSNISAPQIITAPGRINSEYEHDRRPFIYHPEVNKVWLGDMGQLHSDVAQEFEGHPDHPLPIDPYRFPYALGYVSHDKGTTGFYDGGEPHVLQAVGDYTGTKPEAQSGPGSGTRLEDLEPDFDFDRYSSTDIEQSDSEKYPGLIYNHLTTISRVARYADVLTMAALEDVRNHDAKGWHFRNAVLNLNIAGVGPKVASLTWYFLAPMTSELATVDTWMMKTLGYNPKDAPNTRDYYKYERELSAGRDAAGYGHMPLAQFQHAMWDNARTGPGTHQDHSPLRVELPTFHGNVDWNNVLNAAQTSREDYLPPQWWDDTQPARQRVADDFDNTIAPFFSRDMVPKKRVPVDVDAPMIYQAGASKSEFHFALGIPEEVIKKIHSWVHANLDLSDATEIIEPDDYHVTIAYAERGWDNQKAHSIARHFNLKGMKFESRGLAKFGDALVLKLDSPQWGDWADKLLEQLKKVGLNVSEFDGGPKAHITLAYTPSEKRSKAPLALQFRAVDSYVSKPRGYGKRADMSLAIPCPKHGWPDCPICSVDDAAKGIGGEPEHNPEYKPLSPWDDTWEQQKTEWYNTIKEPGTLDNPEDPFQDLKPGIRASVRPRPYDWAMDDGTIAKVAVNDPDGTTVDPTTITDVPPTSSESTQFAAQHTGQIPGDENFLGPLNIHTLNGNSGVNPSYFGDMITPTQETQRVFVKPQGNFHADDLAKERASFHIAQQMGVPMPHAVVRGVHIPDSVTSAWDGDTVPIRDEWSGHRPAIVMPDIGGASGMSQGLGASDVASLYPDEARRIALLDNVIGNNDRHMGNVQIGDDDQLYAIDHGGAFNSNYQAFEHGLAGQFGDEPLTEEERALLQRVQQSVDLSDYGLEWAAPEAQQQMNDRIQRMLESGAFLPTHTW